jgi:hypothetical protein
MQVFHPVNTEAFQRSVGGPLRADIIPTAACRCKGIHCGRLVGPWPARLND